MMSDGETGGVGGILTMSKVTVLYRQMLVEAKKITVRIAT